MEARHADLARAISATAREHGAVADRTRVQEVQLAIAAKPDAVDVGFWRATLGYTPLADDNAADPLGHGSTFWMQELDPDKGLRHAMHIDVSVAREQTTHNRHMKGASALPARGDVFLDVRDEGRASRVSLAPRRRTGRVLDVAWQHLCSDVSTRASRCRPSDPESGARFGRQTGSRRDAASILSRGEAIFLVRVRKNRPVALVVSEHPRRGPDQLTLQTRHSDDAKCRGLRSTWDRAAATVRIRLPSRCVHGGDYGAISA